MRVSDFIVQIIETGAMMIDEVKLDGSVPEPFEDVFELKRDKGNLFIKLKEGVDEYVFRR